MLLARLEPICNTIRSLTWNRITPAYLLAALIMLALALLAGALLCAFGRATVKQILSLCLLLFYLFLLLGGTVVCRTTRRDYSYILRPFWTYASFYKATTRGTILRNCLMLFPVGLLLPPAFPNRRFRLGTIALCALGLSYSIELLQLVLKKGTFELVDDPLHNLLSALLGYGVYRLMHAILAGAKRR